MTNNSNINNSTGRTERSAAGGAVRPRTQAGYQVRPNPAQRQGTGQNPAPAARNPQTVSGRAPGQDQRLNGSQSPRPQISMQQNQMMKTKTTDSVSVLTAGKQNKKESPKPANKSSVPVREKVKKGKTTISRKQEQEDRTATSRNTIMSAIKAVVYIVVIGVVSAFLAIAIITAANDIYAFVKPDTPVTITIPENTKLDELADILHDNGIIKYPWLFKLYAQRKHDDQKYIPGEYTVNGMMNYSTLLSEFKEKVDYGTVRITIPEGYTTDEIIDMFVKEGIGTREGFVDEIQNGEYDYWFIEELENSGPSSDRIYRLDGYLFPDTYDFYKSSSERTVIRKLLKRFSQIFTKQYREQCQAMGYSVDQIVTLASIIEKEAASPAEFFLVSSVFHNRLNNSWAFPRLESDATVVYAIQHDTGERTVDLTYDSAYNTYTHDGLTPGPIANPSASAILAALSPQNSNYFFFVSFNGVTHFSETKAEHDAYIAQYKAEQQALEEAQTEPNE